MHLLWFRQFLLILLTIVVLIPLQLSAQTIQFQQASVDLYNKPGQGLIATLFNTDSSLYPYTSKASYNQSYWLKLELKGWIWKNSTNYQAGKKKVIVVAENENFRIAPNKKALAQLNYNTQLLVLKSGKNWLQVKLTAWIDASFTNFQLPIEEESIGETTDQNRTNVNDARNVQETVVKLTEQSPALLVKRTKLPPAEVTPLPSPQANISPVTETDSILSKYNLNEKYLIFGTIGILILLLLITLISILILSNRLSHSKEQQETKIIDLLSDLQNKLATDLSNNLIPFHESTIRGLEKNKGDIALLIERRMADFNEKLLNNVSTMRVKIAESLSHSNQSQAQAFTRFQSHFSESVDMSLKRNLDSLNKMFHDLRQSTDQHMKEINERVETRLKHGFEQTNQIFIDIKERLNQIDQAQQRISELSNNVVSLQKTLDNKGARGAFGEVQLAEIVKDMIPEKFCKFQQTLSNDKRPDCVIFLPPPTGKLIIDAKFPLENYKLMFNQNISDEDKNTASAFFKRDIKKHIKDISDKYILPGETADGAVMFIPSEAVFAEIHAHHPDLVKQAQLKRVWMASPTTLMALLTTARAVLADDERSKQAKIIHEHLSVLAIEFNRFSKRMDDLAKHINMAHDDVNKINISAKKITDKFEQIENTDLEDLQNTKPIAIDSKISA